MPREEIVTFYEICLPGDFRQGGVFPGIREEIVDLAIRKLFAEPERFLRTAAVLPRIAACMHIDRGTHHVRNVQSTARRKHQEFRGRRDDDIVLPVNPGIPAFDFFQIGRPEILHVVLHRRDFSEHTEQSLLRFGFACQAELIETVREDEAQDINGEERPLFQKEADEVSGTVPVVDGFVEIIYVHWQRKRIRSFRCRSRRRDRS